MQPSPRQPFRWLRALGGKDLPLTIEVESRSYGMGQVFKHDFFAATALYEDGAGSKLILKIGRQASLLGLPMTWIGRFLARHESRLFELSAGLEGIPRYLGRFGPTGIVHE